MLVGGVRSLLPLIRCLHPSEGIVAKASRLAHGIAGVDSENPVRLVAAVGNKQYVATSGLIVHPKYRGLGLAKRIKTASFRLARLRWPMPKFSVSPVELPS